VIAMRSKPALSYFPFSIAAWDRITGDLTDKQILALHRLVSRYATQGGLPNDDHALAAIARTDLRAWLKMKRSLAIKFPGERWVWPEIDQRIAHRQKVSVQKSSAGIIGNRNRWKQERRH
jgi:uncharacterized protein YdaU (DUF1376 family)